MIKTRSFDNSLLPALAACAAVLLSGGASLAHRAEWQSGFEHAAHTASAPGLSALPVQTAPAPLVEERTDVPQEGGKLRCPECGVVESIREIVSVNAGAASSPVPARRYELTLRLDDDSRHLVSGVPGGTWKVGERVIAIAPVSASRRTMP